MEYGKLFSQTLKGFSTSVFLGEYLKIFKIPYIFTSFRNDFTLRGGSSKRPYVVHETSPI